MGNIGLEPRDPRLETWRWRGTPLSVIGTGAQRMNVVERPVTAAETGRAGDRTLDIISGTVYRGLDVETLG